MNVCGERHEPKFKVTYKPVIGQNHRHVWFVCESCLTDKDYFGSDEIIDTMESVSKIIAT